MKAPAGAGCQLNTCGEEIDQTKADVCGVPLLCSSHFDVYQLGYGYMSTAEVVKAYNHPGETKFAECFDATTIKVCNDQRDTNVEGSIKEKDSQIHEAWQDCGAWTRPAPWAIIIWSTLSSTPKKESSIIKAYVQAKGLNGNSRTQHLHVHCKHAIITCMRAIHGPPLEVFQGIFR